MGICRFIVLASLATDLWAHVLSTNTLNLIIGTPQTFELRNGVGEMGCTTIVVIRMADLSGATLNPTSNNVAIVTPRIATYVTPDNPTLAQTFPTFTVTPRGVGRATIFVDWRIDPTDTGPNCTSTTVSSPTVALQVSPLPAGQTPAFSVAPLAQQPYRGGFTELVGISY